MMQLCCSFARGKISFYTSPPEKNDNLISTTIVQDWGRAFSIDALVEAEKQELKSKWMCVAFFACQLMMLVLHFFKIYVLIILFYFFPLQI